MIKIYDKSQCCGCKGCESVCPRHCIDMKTDEEGFWYPCVNTESCSKCGICEMVCPALHSREEKSKILATYAAVTNDEQIRRRSSSGGIFYEFSKNVLMRSGVVYGCAMSNDCLKAEHIRVDSVDQILLLCGSKYLQSDISNIFNKVKHDLREGRQVLFSGTPCQVAGLKRTLIGTQTDKLITVDFICHGVPSPEVWRQYAFTLEQKEKSLLSAVSFRDKTDGWHNYSLKCVFENGREYRSNVTNNLYLRGFVMNDFLRPSCYYCKFKGDSHCSDITMADFWGVEDILPNVADDRGTSLALVHTDAGLKLLECLSEKITLLQVETEDGLKQNPSYYESVLRRKVRDVYFKSFATNPSKILEEFCGLSVRTKVIRKICACIDKVCCMRQNFIQKVGKNR